MVDRRAMLRWGLAGTFGLALPGATAILASAQPPRGVPQDSTTAPNNDPPRQAFTIPLAISTVLQPESTAGGVDRYTIRQTPARQHLLPNVDTTIWGYNGTFPGPTIRARRGRPVSVTHENRLTVPTVVHLHGGVVPPESNGYPVDYVQPVNAPANAALAAHAKHGVAGIASGSRAYLYPNDQPAATLWYHDHRMEFTGPQIYRGLAGFYLISDDIEDSLPLPRGSRDIPVMIADRQFDGDGALFYPVSDPTMVKPGVTVQYHHSGMLGAYNLVLDPAPPDEGSFVQIGSDAGLLPLPVPFNNFIVSPGERYDMLVDFSQYPPGTQVTMKNLLGDGDTAYVMRFVVTRRVTDDARIPSRLTPDLAPLPGITGTADRRFSFFVGPEGVKGPPMINFQTFAMARIDSRPVLGSTEIWDLTADPTHPIHLHGAHFRIVKRDGKPPTLQDDGWKDTVFVPTGGMRLAVDFSGHRGKYLVHCRNLEHGDAGMMANMEIV